MLGIEFNTWIGLAFIVMLPAAMIWTCLSLHVLLAGGTVWRRSNYRLAVTIFLAVTTVNIADFIRLRYHVLVGPIHPNATAWIVLIERWSWAAAFWWATVVLYGHYVPKMIRFAKRRRVSPNGQHDPYLDDETEDPAAMLRLQSARVGFLSARLQQVAEELGRIIDRIERDDPIALPDESARITKETT